MQQPKDIVVYFDSQETRSFSSHLSYAGALAQAWDAHLAVAFVPEDLALNLHSGFTRGAATFNMLNAFEHRRRESEDLARKLLAEVAARSGISVEFRVCEGEHGEALMLHARHSSLAILGAAGGNARRESALTLSEEVIFASGRPSILLPAEWSGLSLPKRVLIGWNASREAARAIADALPLLQGADETHIIVVPEATIKDRLGEDPGMDISRHLSRYGINVVLERVEGDDASRILLEKAQGIEADLLVMGAYGQSKITEFVFGSVTQSLLESPDIPVLLSR